MPNIKIKLKKISDIVNFHFYYSQYQHIGWPRSSRKVSNIITIYTTNDMIEKNLGILILIKKYLNFEILSATTKSVSSIPD
tara:strand:- start:925 stop:1167 length:243 start_codon:yes stop_codon:yes gene_type:complete